MDRTLAAGIESTALAFRGYNVTNLGRTRELLAFPSYYPILSEELRRYGALAADYVGRTVDLVARVRDHVEPGLPDYVEAVALIIAIEVAHVRLLGEIHGVDCRAAQLSLGFSLGELPAVCLGGVFRTEDVARVPFALAVDCAAMADECTLGVLFSRGPAVSEESVFALCARITARGAGTIGVSAILSPNTYLVVGQGETVVAFREDAKSELSAPAHVRINDAKWPPLHTPILRQKSIGNRAGVMLEKLSTGDFPPRPEVVSLVTGNRGYAEHTARDILAQWVERPQRLWDGICEILAADVKTVLHLGAEPNLIPATFARLSENVLALSNRHWAQRYGLAAVTSMARRPWLAAMLPARAALLRAPYVKHVIAEDWLLDNAP